YGFRDADADGYADELCCNTGPAGTTCGPDCDDMSPPTHPSANETCNAADDDCNGLVDDIAGGVFLDCDGDGFGDPAHAAAGCPHPVVAGDCTSAARGGGCDDAVASSHPGATETCNMADDDCNTIVDDVGGGGCSCTPPDTRSCGV